MSTEAHIYRRSVDPEGSDSLAYLARAVRPRSLVLELGVATGYFSRFLASERECTVDGVELSAEMARQAEPHCRSLVVGDLEEMDLSASFPGVRYDYVICADVLEHLRGPERVLKQIPRLLAPGGRLLVSVPNAGYAGLVLELASGELRYRSEGLLDATHIRFFTRASVVRLLNECGFEVERVDPVPLPFDRSEFRDYFEGPDTTGMREGLKALPDADAYQFVLVAAPRGEMLKKLRTCVDVVIPVYRGLVDTRRCLESVLGSPQETPFEVLVINDASPEPALADYLRELAASGRITLLNNAENLGFPGAVNRGLVQHSDRDAVVLNSDTEVYGRWLDRLARAAYSAPDVGTVTPFSNNATICGYPRFCCDNPLPAGMSGADLDSIFARENAGCYDDIPTAIGFCMYLRRDCLARTGLLDALRFGRGYGEENDFCERARALGFRHLLCGDTFVYHRGGVSFGGDADTRREDAQKTLRGMHPAYAGRVGDYVRRDPARPLRRRVDLARLRASPLPKLLFVTHGLGGGTEKHVRDLTRLLETFRELLVLRPLGIDQAVLTWGRSGEEFSAYFALPAEYGGLVNVLREVGVSRVHFHHLMGLTEVVQRVPDDLGVEWDFTAHDYYAICPQYSLTDNNGAYCGEPDEAGCNRCLAERPAPNRADIATWRQVHGDFLRKAARVIVPSEDAGRRLRRYLPAANLVVLPHPEPPETGAPHSPCKVLVLGRLTPAKGLNVLEACAKDARTRGLPLLFCLVGHTHHPVSRAPDVPLEIRGQYDAKDLRRLIDQERADIIFFPQMWPETYSYTLSVAIAAGMPIACTDLGAMPERLADYPHALIRSWRTPAAAWNDLFLRWRDARFTPLTEDSPAAARAPNLTRVRS